MADPSLQAALQIASIVESRTELLLIGALAMAAHGYPRQTTDIDFAIAIPVSDLSELVRRLQAAGPLFALLALRQQSTRSSPPAGNGPQC